MKIQCFSKKFVTNFQKVDSINWFENNCVWINLHLGLCWPKQSLKIAADNSYTSGQNAFEIVIKCQNE